MFPQIHTDKELLPEPRLISKVFKDDLKDRITSVIGRVLIQVRVHLGI